MSNPFRRQQTPTFTARDTPPTVDSSQASTPTADPSPPFTSTESRSSADRIPANPPVASSKVKKVRITSPPRSPPPDPRSSTESAPLQQRLATAHHSDSSYRQSDEDSSSSEDGSLDDPFAREQSSGEESPAEGTHRQPIAADPARTGSRARLNPFSKTLAAVDESKQQPLAQQEQGNVGLGEGRAGAKAPMDVDSFKNLLMTGKATPSGAAASVQPRALTSLQADSSSSTDTSSISRQSLFENHQEPHGETPRTSYELSVSEDDDRATLIAESSRAEKRKPPPPKHRYGKVVAPKGPQTVAFDDFSPTFATPSAHGLPIKDGLSRTQTDPDKPLPPPPPRTSSDEPRPSSFDLQLPTRQSLPPQSSSDPLTSLKKVPPAPPLARRSSLMRSNNQPSRRRSDTQTAEETSSPPGTTDDHNPSTTKIAPPPPPTRRSRAGTGTTDPPSSVEIPDSQDRRQSIINKSPHSLPRQTSCPQQSSSPTIAAVTAVTTSPPPPPPRRASTRSSTDFGRPSASSPPGSSRPSGEMTRGSFDVERMASAGGPQERWPIFEEPSEGTENVGGEDSRREREIDGLTRPAADVLADMEAFQREVDELRERYGKGGG